MEHGFVDFWVGDLRCIQKTNSLFTCRYNDIDHILIECVCLACDQDQRGMPQNFEDNPAKSVSFDSHFEQNYTTFRHS